MIRLVGIDEYDEYGNINVYIYTCVYIYNIYTYVYKYTDIYIHNINIIYIC